MKTWALFMDAYRELNSKKLFWITMLLSGLVVGVFGALGLRENGIGFLWFTLPSEFLNSQVIDPAEFYKTMFNAFGVRFWLSIIATVLALITTAGMIPDFISGGSVELMLSKPISRARLYLTKFLTGLLFVALQVFVFSLASLLVIGVRGGVWEPGILLSVPIVVLFYSYLFCVCTLLGLVTRSTLAALLLTVLFWFLLFLLNTADETLLTFKASTENRVVQQEERLESQKQRLEDLLSPVESAEPATDESPEPQSEGFLGRIADEFRSGTRPSDLGEEDRATQIERVRNEITTVEATLEDTRSDAASLGAWHGRIVAIKTVLPKTKDTLNLLDRHLISDESLDASEDRMVERRGNEDFARAEFEAVRQIRDRPLWWVIGTSLAFEAFILALGAWIFSRRDF
jgi:ABC-type transport system involved in multi-copper enzyme maturation permease subunit